MITRLINNKYELKIEKTLDIHTNKIDYYYTLYDYEYNQKNKFEPAKILIETNNFTEIAFYLDNNK